LPFLERVLNGGSTLKRPSQGSHAVSRLVRFVGHGNDVGSGDAGAVEQYIAHRDSSP